MTAGHPEDFALMDFVAGSLPAESAAKISAHLQGCQRCKAVLKSQADNTSQTGRRTLTPLGPDTLIGQRLGEFRVLERLGEGGMAALYRGDQPVIGKPVVIKVLLRSNSADPVPVQRMLGEARAATAIRHPNIVDIFSFGHAPDGRPYMVMELLEGRSLSSLIAKSGRLTPAQTVTVLSQAMAGLEAAHAAGVIHRDLKPDNIYVDERPDGWRLKLLDFGIAKRDGVEAGLTAPGMVMGTPGYMAPEQVRGTDELTTATDIYSMGVVAWTMLVGREPFQGHSVVAVMNQHLKSPAPPLRPLVGELPAALDELVMRMVEKEPGKRPTATEARAILARIAKGEAPAGPPAATATSRSEEPLLPLQPLPQLPLQPLPQSPPQPAAPPPPQPLQVSPSGSILLGGKRGRGLALLVALCAVGSGLAFAGWWANSPAAFRAPPPLRPPVIRPVPLPDPLPVIATPTEPPPVATPSSETAPVELLPAFSTASPLGPPPWSPREPPSLLVSALSAEAPDVTPPPDVPAPTPAPVTWRCANVRAVGELYAVIDAPRSLFNIVLEAPPNVLVTAARTPKGTRDLKRLQKAVKACRRTAGILIAPATTPASLSTKRGVFTGDAVEVGSIAIGKAPRSRSGPIAAGHPGR